MRILLFLLLLSPVFASAQILRAYGVIEVGSLPTSSVTGPKFAYRPADSSFYRWVSGSTWVKIIPDEPDTLYLKQLSGTTALVDGDTIDISTYFLKSDTTSAFASYLKRPVGWGLSLLTGKYPFVDSSKVASRYYAGTNPTTIAANYAAVSNGTNLIARNLFDNNTYAGVISRPWKFGEYTTAGLPTGVTGYHVYNTTIGGTGWYDGTRWNYVPKADRSAFTDTYVPHTNSSGQLTEHTGLRYNNATSNFGIGGAPLAQLHLQGNKSAASWTTNGIGLRQDAATYTNTTSSGTVTTQYAHTIGIPTFASSSSTTITDASTLQLRPPAAGTNTTITNAWALWANGSTFATRQVLGQNILYSVGIMPTYRTTSNLASYISNSSGGRAGITSQAHLLTTGNTGYGIMGAVASGGIANAQGAGVFSEATGNSANGSSSFLSGFEGTITTEGGYALNAYYARLRLYSTVVGGAQSNTLNAFNVTISERNNAGATNLRGFYYSGLPGVSGSNTGITNHNPLAINSGNTTNVTNTWSFIESKTTIGSTTNSSEELDVYGDAYIRDSTRLGTTPAHSSLSGVAILDGNNWVGKASIAGGLGYSGGVLTSTWLKPELNAANVDINANAHSLQFDSIPALYLTAESTAQLGGAYIEQKKWLNTSRTKYFSRGFLYDSRAAISGGMPAFYNLLTINNGSGDGFEWANELIRDTTAGVFVYGYGGRYNEGYLKFGSIRSNTAGVYLSVPRFWFYGTSSPENATANTYHTLWSESNTPSSMLMGLKDGGKFLIGSDSTFIFDPNTDLLHIAGTARITGSTGTPTTVVGRDGSGNISNLGLSGLSVIAGVLTATGSADGNGIYSGSATLANHTTRARVPDDGNLFFSQTYNGGADSSFFYFANATSGERYVGLGMTDTASTGGASLLFGNDGAGEMSFELQTIDAVNGNTQIRGIGGDLNLSSSAGNISLSTNVANEVRVTGLVRAKQEAYYEITSTSSPQTFSNDYSDNFVNQGGTQASFTFLFPASPEDGQILSVTWNNAISVLTLDGNGNTITGTAVTTAVAGTRRQFKYYASASAWIKIY